MNRTTRSTWVSLVLVFLLAIGSLWLNFYVLRVNSQDSLDNQVIGHVASPAADQSLTP